MSLAIHISLYQLPAFLLLHRAETATADLYWLGDVACIPFLISRYQCIGFLHPQSCIPRTNAWSRRERCWSNVPGLW